MEHGADIRLRRSPNRLTLDIVGTDGRIKRIEADPTTRRGLNSIYSRLIGLENDNQITQSNSIDAMGLITKRYGYNMSNYMENNLPNKLVADLAQADNYNDAIQQLQSIRKNITQMSINQKNLGERLKAA